MHLMAVIDFKHLFFSIYSKYGSKSSLMIEFKSKTMDMQVSNEVYISLKYSCLNIFCISIFKLCHAIINMKMAKGVKIYKGAL